jgi:phosphate uptake regulator
MESPSSASFEAKSPPATVTRRPVAVPQSSASSPDGHAAPSGESVIDIDHLDFFYLPRMATMSLEMLRDSITAFINREPERARRVIPRDRDVDDLNRQLHRELSSFMVERPTTISRCLRLMVISKALERIADHATSVAEQVVYLYEAKDIRHTNLKNNEAQNSPG